MNKDKVGEEPFHYSWYLSSSLGILKQFHLPYRQTVEGIAQGHAHAYAHAYGKLPSIPDYTTIKGE